MQTVHTLQLHYTPHGGVYRNERKESTIAQKIVNSIFVHDIREQGNVKPVMGKHPDLMVAHPTSTIFTTIGRNFEIS